MNSQNYLVVGGSSGIGKAILTELVHSGLKSINFSRKHPEIDNIDHYTLDIVTDELPELTQPISSLIYCPGSINLKPFKSLKKEDFLKDLEINFFGAVKVIQKYLPNLILSGNGSIVLFSTIAVEMGMPFHSSIASTKGAIEGLVKSLAAEFAPKIRVNAIAPSLTDTPLATKLLDSDAKRIASQDRHPLKKIGNPEDIAKMAVFLTSDSAQFMTGQIIKMDGGMSSVR